jgi:hypothetical protein
MNAVAQSGDHASLPDDVLQRQTDSAPPRSFWNTHGRLAPPKQVLVVAAA